MILLVVFLINLKLIHYINKIHKKNFVQYKNYTQILYIQIHINI